MKTKKIYNPPITEMVEVEFEGGFMQASNYGKEIDLEKNPTDAGDQAINGNFDFTDEEWRKEL